MLRNPMYVYGSDDAALLAHLHLGKHMLQMFAKYQDNVALIDADTNKKMTFSELAQLSVDIALSLKRLNVGVGDVVSICCDKRMEFMPTVVGILCTGAAFSAADNSMLDENILYRLNITKPKVLFLSKDAYEKHQATLRKVDYIKHTIVYTDEHIGPMSFKEFLTEHAPIEDFEATPVEGWKDIAIIQFSSGTTGMPKAAIFTHKSFMMVTGTALCDQIDKHRITLSTREWYYSFGLYHSLSSLSRGFTIVFTLKNDAVSYLEAIEKYKVDTIQIVPTTITDLVKCPDLDKYDVSSLQVMNCASIPISSELVSVTKERFQNLQCVTQIYGLTESGCIIREDVKSGINKLGSVGVACQGTVIKVVDLETQKPVGPYKRGEIRFKCSYLMSGYIGDEECAYLDEEGFYKSGDVGYYDDEKYFFIVDRIHEIIKYNGYTLSPSEIENTLVKHPSIREVGVTSLPFSEAPVAFIVRQTNCAISEDQVAEYLSSKIDADTNKKTTFSELAQLSVDIALSLKRLNVGVGDVVSICCDKRMEFMPTVVGILCTGAAFSAADNSMLDENILYRLNITKPKVLFLSKDAYEKHQATLRKVDYIKHTIVYTDEHIGPMSFKEFLTEHAPIEDFEATPVEGWKDIAIIQFSSGTTGMPKAAIFTHKSFMMVTGTALCDQIDKHRITLSTREWYYSFGLYHSLSSLSHGFTIVFTLKNDAVSYLEAIEKYKVDTIQIVPTTITDLVKCPDLDKYDVSSLQVMNCASIPISSELVSVTKERFQNLQCVTQIYGLTESGCIIREDVKTGINKLGSVGVACQGTVIKVVDLETQKPVGPYKRGEIRFKCSYLMSGYIGDEECAYLDEEGFYKSGDVGYYDDEKYFFIVDRIHEIIKYNGYTLSPSEIENTLLKHPSIREVGVTSLPFSEAPVAFIVRQTNCAISEDQVAEYLNSKMPSVTMSGGIRFVDKLPRGAGTKLNRKALRGMI